MAQERVQCPECKGEGKIRAIGCPGFKRIEMDCLMCAGAKTVPAKVLEWMKIGQAMKAERIARGVVLRLEAKERGMDAVALSEMERGTREPIPRKGAKSV